MGKCWKTGCGKGKNMCDYGISYDRGYGAGYARGHTAGYDRGYRDALKIVSACWMTAVYEDMHQSEAWCDEALNRAAVRNEQDITNVEQAEQALRKFGIDIAEE